MPFCNRTFPSRLMLYKQYVISILIRTFLRVRCWFLWSTLYAEILWHSKNSKIDQRNRIFGGNDAYKIERPFVPTKRSGVFLRVARLSEMPFWCARQLVEIDQIAGCHFSSLAVVRRTWFILNEIIVRIRSYYVIVVRLWSFVLKPNTFILASVSSWLNGLFNKY